jgi:hypothetical protein
MIHGPPAVALFDPPLEPGLFRCVAKVMNLEKSKYLIICNDGESTILGFIFPSDIPDQGGKHTPSILFYTGPRLLIMLN